MAEELRSRTGKSLQMRNWRKIYGWKRKQHLGKGLGTPAGGSVGDLCALCLSHGGGLKTVSEDNTLLQEEKTPTISPFIMCRYPMKVFHCLLEGKTVNVICWEKKPEAVWGLRTLEKELVLILSTWVQYQRHLILDHCTSVLNCPSASPTTPFIDTNQSKKITVIGIIQSSNENRLQAQRKLRRTVDLFVSQRLLLLSKSRGMSLRDVYWGPFSHVYPWVSPSGG